MKNFIKKILAFLRKCWSWLVSLIYKVPADKRLHFVAGFVIASFFAITFGMKECFVAAFFAGFIKEFFDKITTDQWDWWDFGATCIGGALPQIFVLLNIWWF